MFNKNSRFMIALLVLLSLLIVACGEDDEDDDNGDNGNGGASVELSETFTTDVEGVGQFSADHPSGWAAVNDEMQGIYLATSEDFLTAFQATDLGSPVEGEGAAVNINPLPLDSLPPDADTAQAIFDQLAPTLTETEGEEESNIEVGDASSFDADNFGDAVKASLTAEGQEGVLYILLGDEFALLVAGIVGDEAGTLDAIVSSMSIEAAAADEGEGDMTEEDMGDEDMSEGEGDDAAE
jgi:hypothetical protein